MKINDKVLLFAPQGFEDIEVAAFTNIFGWTRVLKEVKPVDVVIAGTKRNIRSKHDLIIKAHVLLDEVRAGDYRALVIPGGHNDSGWTEVYKESVMSLIREVYENGGIIAAMCVAALPVARSGILRGIKATTYAKSRRHDNLQILRDYGAVPVRRKIVVSERIITNRGPDTSVDVAFKLLEMLNGKEDMERVGKALMFKLSV
jgi:4-methyl-5(b-hydroxyethyl)-thiazole monophosphate biosynthesis